MSSPCAAAAQSLIPRRPDAVGGRAFHDLHGDHYVLRYVLVLAVSARSDPAGDWIGWVGSFHHGWCHLRRTASRRHADRDQLYYHYLQDPDFHQNAFAILLIVIMARSTYIMEANIRPSWKEKYGMKSPKSIGWDAPTTSEQLAINQRDTAILKNMWLMVTLGLSIFLCGFGIWTLDNVFCSTVRQWRHRIGLPWGILLEGHGWW